MAEIGGPVVNLSEDEIRLELLKLAHISLHEEYNFNREQQTWVWDAKVRNCLSNNTPVPEHPGYVSHPTDKDTVKRAKLFSEFIFNGK
jgi:hypothetical protein